MRFQNPTQLDMNTEVFGVPVSRWDEMFTGGMEETLLDNKRRNMKDNKITNYSIFTAYREVEKFNKIAGNLENVTAESISNQFSYIFEELVEGIDGYEAATNAVEDNYADSLDVEEAHEIIKDSVVEILDSACDLFVTVTGLMQKLEAAGFDVATALKRVNENNMSKYIPANKAIHYDPSFTKTLNEEYNVYVLRDSNMKIRKPSGFVSVDLSDCVPEGFFGEQV
jgi:predicted HAD superfamily Cof-like phosphohydrolase